MAFLQPTWFIGLKGAIVPLLGLVMFGMGLTLKLEDFAEVARHPWRVALGVVAHFVIMPGVAWLPSACWVIGFATRWRFCR